MSIEVINEALELLHITQNNMGPDREWLPSEEQAHWDRVSKCRDELEKLKQQEPVAHSTEDGDRVVTDKTYAGAMRDGGAAWSSMRPFSVPLYAAPVTAAVPQGWKLVPVEPTRAIVSALEGCKGGYIAMYRAMISAAPAAPACEWSVSDDGSWDGSCGIKWSFIDDGPMENGVRFCPKCGGTVKMKEQSNDR